ncbi:ATP-binding protein [Peribacillus frigoritolerans]|uniref:ATP-binding protein n=1 Tax=Peribacillus frigoritolerans TaxID=450367 RepID=UPI0037FEF3F9
MKESSIKKAADGKSLDIKLPRISNRSHPIEQGNYLLDTIEINNLKEVLNDWIESRTPGGIVYGNPRIGKTNAIEFLMRIFESDYNGVVKTFRFNCQKFIRPNENTFFEFLLRDVGHALFDKGKANSKRDRLFKYFLHCGENLHRKQIVLFMDDAQRLQEIEYEWLMDIFNELDRYGITLTSILFGQDELRYLRSTYSEANMKQIVGRFMIHQYNFHGINNIDSLAYFLAGYDYATDYPNNSGWSFTRYYFPKGFALGYRLEDFAETLWKYLQDLHINSMKKKTFEVPLYYMTTVINNVFKIHGTNGEELEWINMTQIKNSLLNSGYYIYEGFKSPYE